MSQADLQAMTRMIEGVDAMPRHLGIWAKESES